MNIDMIIAMMIKLIKYFNIAFMLVFTILILKCVQDT